MLSGPRTLKDSAEGHFPINHDWQSSAMIGGSEGVEQKKRRNT
jgi:hypothetical protein